MSQTLKREPNFSSQLLGHIPQAWLLRLAPSSTLVMLVKLSIVPVVLEGLGEAISEVTDDEFRVTAEEIGNALLRQI